ncbi:MAG: T9SS type A sorting domain-containing protein [Chitinivibrionales bacterium]|nr:T9SS type A sorting domain-containing protein [Chitinivibrionales bacterium]
MVLKRFNCFTYSILLVHLCIAGEPVEQMDMFDASGNPLFYVTFDYDDGKLSGRTVYDYTGKARNTNGYVLARSSVTLDGSGDRTREEYRDAVDQTRAWSTWSHGSDQTTFSFYDHYSAKQAKKEYEGSYSSGSQDGVFEFFDAGNAATHKIEYLYEGNDISLINVYDKSDNLTHYAVINSPTVEISSAKIHHSIQKLSVLEMPGQVRVSFYLLNKKKPSINLYDLQGRLVAVLFNRALGKGLHRLVFPTQSRKSGVYVIKISLDNDNMVRRIRVVQ